MKRPRPAQDIFMLQISYSAFRL